MSRSLVPYCAVLCRVGKVRLCEYSWRELRDKINRRQTDRQQVDEGAATTPRLGHISHHCAKRVQQLRLHSRFQDHQVHVHLERDNKQRVNKAQLALHFTRPSGSYRKSNSIIDRVCACRYFVLTSCHARRELSVPKLQHFLSFEHIFKYNPGKTNSLLLNNFYTDEFKKKKKKKGDESLYTVWSLVMVRSQLPAQVANEIRKFGNEITVHYNIIYSTSLYKQTDKQRRIIERE